ADLPPIAALDWRKDTPSPPKKTSRLIIDAPAGVRGAPLEELVKATDIVLVPVLPSPFDEAATARFVKRLDALKPVRKGKRAVGLIANRIRTRSRAAGRLEEFLKGLDHEAIARLRDASLYADLALDGMSLFDARGRRAEDLREDWRPLLAFVEQHAD
ncbi:MAG: ParA family protein, partial [Pseudomonadota bacterium]